MRKGTIFIAGVYGVGKSTICQELGLAMKIPVYTASELISVVNKEQYGNNKAVNDIDTNQHILCSQVSELLCQHPIIILAGHFCIFDRENVVECIPKEIFPQLMLTQVVLLEARIKRIQNNLLSRDSKY